MDERESFIEISHPTKGKIRGRLLDRESGESELMRSKSVRNEDEGGKKRDGTTTDLLLRLLLSFLSSQLGQLHGDLGSDSSVVLDQGEIWRKRKAWLQGRTERRNERRETKSSEKMTNSKQ